MTVRNSAANKGHLPVLCVPWPGTYNFKIRYVLLYVRRMAQDSTEDFSFLATIDYLTVDRERSENTYSRNMEITYKGEVGYEIAGYQCPLLYYKFQQYT